MKKLMLLLMVFIIPQFSFGELIFKDATDLCKNQNYTECGSPKRAVTNTTNLKDAFEEFVKYVNHLPSIPAGLKSYQQGIAGLHTNNIETRTLRTSINGNKYTFTTELERVPFDKEIGFTESIDTAVENKLKQKVGKATEEFTIGQKVGKAVAEFTINQKNIDIVLYIWGEK